MKVLFYQKNAHGITLKKLIKERGIKVVSINLPLEKYGLLTELPVLALDGKLYNFTDAVIAIDENKI